MRILFIIPLMILCFTPVADAKKPKDVMKVRKIRKTLKKIYNLDDTIPVPLYRGVDIEKVAGSSTNENYFNSHGTFWINGLGQG